MAAIGPRFLRSLLISTGGFGLFCVASYASLEKKLEQVQELFETRPIASEVNFEAPSKQIIFSSTKKHHIIYNIQSLLKNTNEKLALTP